MIGFLLAQALQAMVFLVTVFALSAFAFGTV
jgi:hypothetical protein